MVEFKGYVAAFCATAAIAMYPQSSIAAPACEGAELVSSGKLVVAYPGDMPMTMLKDGRLSGIDGDIVRRIAERLGFELEPMLMEWSALIESVKSRRADMMISSVGWTEARSRVMAMTDPIYYTGALMTQREDEAVTMLDQLADKSVGTIQGFSWIPELKAVATDLKLYDTSETAMRDLSAGRVDVLFLDPMLAQYATTQNPDLKFRSVAVAEPFDEKRPGLTSKYNIVIGLSQQAPKLMECVNAAIREQWSTCENRKILESYGFGDESWMTPPETNPRNGIDRDADWLSPALGDCKES